MVSVNGGYGYEPRMGKMGVKGMERIEQYSPEECPNEIDTN